MFWLGFEIKSQPQVSFETFNGHILLACFIYCVPEGEFLVGVGFIGREGGNRPYLVR